MTELTNIKVTELNTTEKNIIKFSNNKTTVMNEIKNILEYDSIKVTELNYDNDVNDMMLFSIKYERSNGIEYKVIAFIDNVGNEFKKYINEYLKK